MESRAQSLSRKRKHHHAHPSKVNSHPDGARKSKKTSNKMLKLFQKRARAYNSDEDEMEEDGLYLNKVSSDGEQPYELDVLKGFSGSENEEEDEGFGIQQEATKFTEGCRAFRMAFLTIMKKNVTNDPLGPILSSHKILVAEKLAEEEAEHKAKSVIRREKRKAAEKGHVKLAGFLDAKEKLLISVATKGVVKLFNAVNKSQNPQKGLNPANSKDAKALAKKRKETFFSELKKSTTTITLNSSKDLGTCSNGPVRGTWNQPENQEYYASGHYA